MEASKGKCVANATYLQTSHDFRISFHRLAICAWIDRTPVDFRCECVALRHAYHNVLWKELSCLCLPAPSSLSVCLSVSLSLSPSVALSSRRVVTALHTVCQAPHFGQFQRPNFGSFFRFRGKNKKGQIFYGYSHVHARCTEIEEIRSQSTGGRLRSGFL